ncbi:hypothetical protein [Glycomyces tritici]|uniref:DUF732 domain-containing protein n=1 Tax=Glycomyces tritici TaxID=2665176 RepID=A0ABT7YM33_9ACTN|nr:hypothetical protein [Glycomyces tritici]MDN3239684.1 hypothetical protein [Glycomyces tritici]
MRFIAEHAFPLGLTLTCACIALALVRILFSPRESKKFVANALAIAFVFLGTTFWFVANRDYILEHDTSFADLFNEEPRTSLPTETGPGEWKAAFSSFALTWTEEGTLETEPPSDLISFDPDIDGYYAGQGSQEGASLFAAIGFEDGDVAWFTCHALGIRTSAAEEFLNTCWTAAAVTGADHAAGAERLAWALKLTTEAEPGGGLVHVLETYCPAHLNATSLSSTSTYLNMQFSITPATDC